MFYYLLLFCMAILPVVVLMIYIYRQDKYQKEPVKSLIKAFVGGIIAIPLDIMIVTPIQLVLGETFSDSVVFFNAFLGAGIPEELSKFIIFMIFIWRDKNFDEYFDGIIYASFIGLGFACVENILYVFQFGFGTSIVRALFSVPAHFLFGIIMGYFLSMAKFDPEKRAKNLMSGLLLAMLAHGLFDFLLMASETVSTFASSIIYIVFLVGDIFLWRVGIKYIRKQQENSKLQAESDFSSDEQVAKSLSGYDPEFRQIDWNAGDRP